MIIVKIMKEAQIMRFIEHSSNPKEMKNEKKKNKFNPNRNTNVPKSIYRIGFILFMAHFVFDSDLSVRSIWHAVNCVRRTARNS